MRRHDIPLRPLVTPTRARRRAPPVRAVAALAPLLAAALLSTLVALPSAAAEPRRWWLGDWSDGYANGRCTVRVEASRGQFRREISCPGGVDARWGGEWNAEYRDGPCYVRQIARRESLIEEVECTVRR